MTWLMAKEPYRDHHSNMAEDVLLFNEKPKRGFILSSLFWRSYKESYETFAISQKSSLLSGGEIDEKGFQGA